MTLKEAWFGVAIALTVVAAIVLVHRLFRPQAAETQTSKIEEVRRDNPLLPVNEDLSKFAKTVRTVTIKKPVPESPPARPTMDAQDAHPAEVVTLPPPGAKPVESPIQLRRPPPRQVQNDDDDEPKHSSNDGICAKYGGHKVTFRKRNGWESWRCVYPNRR